MQIPADVMKYNLMMVRRTLSTFASLLVLISVPSALATSVAINTDSAKAVLDALQNPALTREASLKIAAMRGNQGIIRKSNEFNIPANTQNFADALYDAAHGITATDPIKRSYFFDLVKPKVPQLIALVDMIVTNPADFQQPIEHRIAMFTPPSSDLHLQGYIVAGGDGGGYAFGSTDFYLNIGMTDEFVLAKGVTTHELYHAVQGAFAKDRGAVEELPSLEKMSRAQQVCVKTSQLFANLYEEGSAVYVEDISLLQNAQSELGRKKQADITDGIKRVHTSVSLLEMSVLSFQGDRAMSYDDVYDVGFYGHGILYNVGYVIAKAISDQDGPEGLAAFLKLPSQQFIMRYTQLLQYGHDKDHPELGPNTVTAAERLAKTCR